MTSNVVIFNKSTPGFYPVNFAPGIYKVDVYGAKGSDSSYQNCNNKGGRGGHTSGKITFYRKTVLFAFVGGAGAHATSTSSFTGGGFNGGGNGLTNTNDSPKTAAGGGGGASDLRLDANNLYTRIIIAGGGGGSTGNIDQNGGYGGGSTGGNGSAKYSYQAIGATQASPGYSTGNGNSGSFGFGGNASEATDGWVGGGGGVRWKLWS